MPRMTIRIAIFSLLALAILGGTASAQDALRAWGLSGSMSAQARGLEAVGRNPALLADPAADGFYFGLASLGLDLGNNTLSLSRYNEISGAVLDSQAKDDLLAEVPASGLRVDAGLEASALGFRKGRFALTGQMIGRGGGNLDRDVFELVLLGNEIDKAFSFEDTDGQGYAMGAATLSYAHPVKQGDDWSLSMGLNLHYLYGLFEFRAVEASGGLYTSMDGLDGSARAEFLTSRGGSGYAMDFGFAATVNEVWRLGLMWEGLLGSMNWSKEVEHRLWVADAQDILLGQDDIDDAIEKSDSTWTGDPYSGDLPSTLRMGVLRDWSRITLALETEMRLRGLQGEATGPAAMLGAEWRALSWLRPRLGMSIGNEAQGAVAGLGLHLGVFRMDLYGGVRGGYLPGGAQGLTLGSAFSFDF
jgi:hypothetical protein